jgi:outer membrane protein insertion porin family
MYLVRNFIFIIVFSLQFLNVIASENVQKIEVIGNKRVPTDTILYYLDFKIGDKATKENIDNSVKNLYSQGFFSDISIKQSAKNVITIKIEENPVIRKITIEGSKKLKAATIKKELQVKEGTIYSKFQLDSDVKRIESTYKKMGYFATSAQSTIKMRGQDSVDVTIFINEGEKPKIKKIIFYGNTKFSQKDLLKIIASKEAAWYRLFSSSDLYDQDRIMLDKDLLKQHYMQEGYANFKVLSSTSEITPNGESFLLTYIITEGERFNFGKSSIDCQIKDIDATELKKFIDYKEGEIFNESLIDKTVYQITSSMGNKGYTFIDVDYNLEKDEKNKIVNIRYTVNETAKYFVKNINIIGNTRTLDRVIRRELRIYEGDPFNLSKIQRSKQKVANLGYFSSVEFENKQTSEFDKLDLDIKVKETSTGSMRFAIGYNTASGAIGSTTLSEYNFLGKGQIVEFDFSKAKKSSDISFSFTEPKFMDRNLAVGFDIFTTSQDKSDQSSFNAKSKGLTLRTGYDINEYLYHNINYSIKNEKSDKSKDASIFLKAQPNKTRASSIGHSITYDKLNSRISPTKGYMVKITQNFAGVGGNVKYLQHQLYTSYFKPLYKENVILNLIGRAGNIRGIGGNNVNVNDSFFVGEDYIRGFDVSGIGPRVKKYTGNDDQASLGGNTFFAGTAEIQFPLGLPEEFGMKGAVFSDFGTLFDTDAAKYKCEGKDCGCDSGVNDKKISSKPLCEGGRLNSDYIDTSKKIRASYGVGLVWDSPLGFIRLDYGTPFTKESFDKTSRVRFSIGTNF